MGSRSFALILLAAAVWAAGCAPRRAPVAARAAEDEHFEAAWDAAVDVLRQYRFTVDHADRREKVITTLPMVGRYWFEFWRADAATPRDVVEGSLHTIYRQALVTVRRAEPGRDALPVVGSYVAEVEVRVSRSNRAAPQLTSTSEAYEMFLDPGSIARPATGGERGGPIGDVRVSLGRDKDLEKILRQRINALAAKKLTIYPRR